jgi:hypothetical protein
MNFVYQTYTCSGDRESGSYASYGENYTEAAKYFGDHRNNCGSFVKYGSNWKEEAQKEGMSKDHMYMIDEKGNRLLLFNTGETTTFMSKEFQRVQELLDKKYGGIYMSWTGGSTEDRIIKF